MRRFAWGAIVVCLGVAIGVGGYAFVYAAGTSYLSSDPAACANCHIMQSQYDSWQKASHHTAATCVDCHLPAHGLAKWWAKGVNGYHHSKGFTLQDFHEPIMITPKNAAILQENCVRCHGDLVHDLVPEGTTGRDALGCVHCHDAVGHGTRTGLGGRDRGDEQEAGR